MNIKETTKIVSPHDKVISSRGLSVKKKKSEWVDYSEGFAGGIVLDLPNIFGYKV